MENGAIMEGDIFSHLESEQPCGFQVPSLESERVLSCVRRFTKFGVSFEGLESQVMDLFDGIEERDLVKCHSRIVNK